MGFRLRDVFMIFHNWTRPISYTPHDGKCSRKIIPRRSVNFNWRQDAARTSTQDACATYFEENYRTLQAPAGFRFLCLIEKNQLLFSRRTQQRQRTIRE